MEDLKVTLIIPVYSAEKYIERCARSLYEQTYINIEYIWVNDATPDSSIVKLRQITNEYLLRREHVLIIDFKKNKGPTIARYTALSKATGDYVFFCDSDDWADTLMIEELVQHAILHDSDIVWCDYYCTYEDKEVRNLQDFDCSTGSCISNLLTENMHGAYWNKLIKRQLFKDNSILYLPEANMCEDLLSCIQLMYYSRQISYCPQSYYHYIQDNDGSLSATFSPKKLSQILANVDCILRFLDNKNIKDQFASEINYLKLLGKRTLLTSTDLSCFKQWSEIYPESNKYILSYKSLPLTLRLVGWCSYRKLWWGVLIWIGLKKLKNRKRR